MNNTDINELARQLRVSALKASRGVWRGAMTRFNGITNNEVTAVLFNREPEAIIASAVEKRDAEFIALANPINTLIILDALEAAQKRIAELEASQPVVPEGYCLVPLKATQAHLNSIAMRYRHDFYLLNENERDSALSVARQMYSECTGQGFYSIPAAPALQEE